MRRWNGALLLGCMAVLAGGLAAPPRHAEAIPPGLNRINHVIVVFMENWSFDGLLGFVPGANGINQAPPQRTVQIDQSGQPYPVLPDDPGGCVPDGANLPNAPFDLSPFVPPDQPCDSVPQHRYYQNIYQANNGRNNRFVAFGAGSVPPVPSPIPMSYYDATDMPLGQLAQQFTLCDMTFQSGFGGSWFNHMWLVAARAPYDPRPNPALKAVFRNGFLVKDGEFTPDGWAINDINPNQITPQTYATIGDRLSQRGLTWIYYQGGWDEFLANPDDAPEFDVQHSPFLYFQKYQSYKIPGTPGNLHLKDDSVFFEALQNQTLPTVSFVKPDTKDSLHPGETDVTSGMNYIQRIVDDVQASPYWNDCAIFITFDENGGRWDHVPVPPGDRWGPGTRVPMVVVSPFAKRGFVDHTVYEVTSIPKFLEVRYNLWPLAMRDRLLRNYFQNAFDFSQPVGTVSGERAGRRRELPAAPPTLFRTAAASTVH